MRTIGIASGTKILAPDDSYFSFYNSPYISHGQGSSVDIYPAHQSWKGPVTSPVSGKVLRIKKMRMGRPRGFPTEDYDFGIGIQLDHSQDDIVRILHCEPTVGVGDRIDVGDEIGTTLRSRFFNFWTGPHYHVEVMAAESFERSSRSYPFNQTLQFSRVDGTEQDGDIEFEISEVTEDFVKGFPLNSEHAGLNGLVGLAAKNREDEILGILDGGLSHYKQGGVIGGFDIEPGTEVYFAGSSVGTQSKSNHFLRGPSIRSFLDDHILRGLSCFIYPEMFTRKGVPPLVLVPQQYNQLKGIMNVGDVCNLRIEGKSNTVKAG
jgi:murein DD-endopeptidase MepM/ murein hydrolase activator NlpD